jgi:hypothetical protein
MADALSRKNNTLAAMITQQKQLIWEFERLEIEMRKFSKEYLAGLIVESPLVERIKTIQGVDTDL